MVTNLLIRPALSRAFGGIYVRVDPAALRLRGHASPPVIFCATHSGWFDGYMAQVLNDRVFHHDAYLMMEEVNLKRYVFFTWVGVFGVHRDDPRKAIESIEYISSLLKGRKGRLVWMFPQGVITHPDARPLKLYGGVANIARRVGECALVPVALRYDFLMEQAPDAFALIGPPIFLSADQRVNSRDLTERLAEAMTEAADCLRADVVSYNTSAYQRIFAGRGSANKVWDGVLRIAGRARKAAGL